MNCKVTALKCFVFIPRKVFLEVILILATNMVICLPGSLTNQKQKFIKGAKEVYYSWIINISNMPLHDLFLPFSLATSLLTSHIEHCAH